MALVACAGCSTVAAPTSVSPRKVVPVEVWTGGDDGLTQRLAEAVRNEFRQSSRFALVSGPAPESLRVTIPTHVGWEQRGGRLRVSYELRLSRDGRNLGERSGACWENDLRTCARLIVADAIQAGFH